jgi:3'(2'), 5'-bisphosphate nucleotidase
VTVFDPDTAAELAQALTTISMSAAAAIRCRGNNNVSIKADGSPVTAADRAAETVIREGLARLVPAVPVISEEEAEQERPLITAETYFLVDPLDGTREFVAGRDEYTINIGLISGGSAILGLVAAPALSLIWRGVVGRGAERLEFSSHKAAAAQPIHTRSPPAGELIVVVSRSHLDAQTKAYLASLPHRDRLACGSSLKFCRLAEGAADHYPRLGPTRDWDVAAGHALLTAAGGSVIQPDGATLKYGTPELRIPAFLAWGGPVPTGGALKAAY